MSSYLVSAWSYVQSWNSEETVRFTGEWWTLTYPCSQPIVEHTSHFDDSSTWVQHSGHSNIQDFGINVQKVLSMHLLALDNVELNTDFRYSLSTLLWTVNTYQQWNNKEKQGTLQNV